MQAKSVYNVGKFTPYNLALRSLSEGNHQFEFLLNDTFFLAIDDEQIRKGKVNALVSVKRTLNSFEISFELEGTVKIPCDRCLDDMVQPIAVKELLIVKFGAEYAEEGENVIVIPEMEGELNIAWFMFEFLALAIPIKHVHAPGQCNKEMTSKLRKHSTRRTDEEEDDLGAGDDSTSPDEDTPNDPRWDGLKQLLDN